MIELNLADQEPSPDIVAYSGDAAAFPSVAPAPGGIHPLPATEAVRRTNPESSLRTAAFPGAAVSVFEYSGTGTDERGVALKRHIGRQAEKQRGQAYSTRASKTWNWNIAFRTWEFTRCHLVQFFSSSSF